MDVRRSKGEILGRYFQIHLIGRCETQEVVCFKVKVKEEIFFLGKETTVSELWACCGHL